MAHRLHSTLEDVVGASALTGGLHDGAPALIVTPASRDVLCRALPRIDTPAFAVTSKAPAEGFDVRELPVDAPVAIATSAFDASVELDELSSYLRTGAVATADATLAAGRAAGLFSPPALGAGARGVGACIARHQIGELSLAFGTARDFLNRVEIVTRAGEVARFGSLTRKDVTGYDMLHTVVGSRGVLGVITEACLRVVPFPESVRDVALGFARFDDALEVARALIQQRARLALLEVEARDRGAVLRAVIVGRVDRVTRDGAIVMGGLAGREATVLDDSGLQPFLERRAREASPPHVLAELGVTHDRVVEVVTAARAAIANGPPSIRVRVAVGLGLVQYIADASAPLDLGATRLDLGATLARMRVRRASEALNAELVRGLIACFHSTEP